MSDMKHNLRIMFPVCQLCIVMGLTLGVAMWVTLGVALVIVLVVEMFFFHLQNCLIRPVVGPSKVKRQKCMCHNLFVKDRLLTH